MKNLLYTACIILIGGTSLFAQSTNYTAFEWDVFGAGFAIPIAEDNLSGGLALGGEVRFNLSDYMSVGVGSELVFLNVKNLENLDDDLVAEVDASHTSYLAGDYYFNSTSNLRAFVGVGVGYSTLGAITITPEMGDNTEDDVDFTEGQSGMSLMPRVGYELDHLRFVLSYNLGLKEELSNYISFKASLTLWGGRKSVTDSSL